MQRFAIVVMLVTIAGLFVFNKTSFAADSQFDDLVVYTINSQSLEEVVAAQLKSTKFLTAIAAYNEIEDVASQLPPATEIRIPKPYVPLKNFGRVVYVKGNVTHQQGDRLVNPPDKGAFVYIGDVITTGSSGFISIQFGSDSRANVQPESRMMVGDIDCVDEAKNCKIVLRAIYGEIQNDVNRKNAEHPPVNYIIETPFLSATVRGTRFYTSVNNAGRSWLGVTHGEVAATAVANRFAVLQGKGLLVDLGAAPERRDLLVAPTFANSASIRMVSSEDSINWQPVGDAIGYRVLLATDAKFTQQQWRTDTELPFFNPDNNPGDYFLAVAALDRDEFPGLPAVTRITYAQIVDPVGPTLSIEQRGDQFAVTAPNVDGEVQLSLGNSLAPGAAYELVTVPSLLEPVVLTLDPKLDWVIRGRRLFGERQVSAYSNYYKFSGK